MSTSQFFGLNIGYTGLLAANAALNVTGNNISNVETKGYTRQEATQAAADALRTNTTYGMAGAGVDTKSIDQIRTNTMISSTGRIMQTKGYMRSNSSITVR